ncbi:hypothetical protein HPB50_021094 [Hyalomma asiaticum]|uniref:Uncharacterized protein n=1 Tax=Hyalomma asiaticum TaxID=266040 RepID=A0ACB7TNP5_HYAAI|nr:hypothetical protein HPB50_021094 [Hyalomma asiaticum]
MLNTLRAGCKGQPSSDPTHPDYVPTVFPYRNQGNMDQKLQRYQRGQKRRTVQDSRHEMGNQSAPVQLCGPSTSSVTDHNIGSEDTTKDTCESATETTLTMADVSAVTLENATLKDRVAFLEEQLASAKQRNAELEMQNKPVQLRKITRDIVMKSQKSVKFHTGIVSTEMFAALLQLILSVWSPSTRTALDPEQQLILVLMRLRLGLLTDDLAHRFGISTSSVSRIFHSWLDVLAENFRKFLIWPSRQAVKSGCPKAFQDAMFKNVRGIIDCTEIFIERPTSMTARSQTYSNYKHHNTVKLLLVISPSGSITYVSKAWGGRVSDKELTQHSGLLELVEEGDVYLVDRGFRCEEMFGARGASLLMPSLTKKRAQLPGAEVTMSRKLSSVRIHVERSIQRLKAFRLFHMILPVSFVKRAGDVGYATIDKLAIVCCGLVNLQTPIINTVHKDPAERD